MSRPNEAVPSVLRAPFAKVRVGFLGLAAVLALAGCQDAAQQDAEAGEAPPAAVPAEEPAAGEAAPVVASGSALLDPDAAAREELLAVPSMNEATADALLAGRPYDNMLGVDSVLAAQGLSEEQREAAYARLWKPLDLNTASAEEILLIPGVGERMQHEFEEYRPYRGMPQFRREIGKYVDEEEVARLEQYVAIR